MKIKELKALIWDFNGTLIDDAMVWYKSFVSVIQDNNLRMIDYDEYKDIYQHPVRKMFEKVGYDFEQDHGLHIFEELDYYYSHYRNEIVLFDDAKEILNLFKIKKLSQSILSALYMPRLEEYLSVFGINSFFNYISGARNKHGISKVEAGKELMKKISIRPENIIMIGDSTHDYETAQCLEIGCVLVARGNESKRRLLKNPVPVFDNFLEVSSCLEELC